MSEKEYQDLFTTIINSIIRLFESMELFWNFMNTPILNTSPNWSINIPFSLDIGLVFNAILSEAPRIAFQVLFFFTNTMFEFMGIDLMITPLTLLFSNAVFVLLGWIVVKSLII